MNKDLKKKVDDTILLGLANHTNEFLNPGFIPGMSHEDLKKVLERIMDSRLNERIMKLIESQRNDLLNEVEAKVIGINELEASPDGTKQYQGRMSRNSLRDKQRKVIQSMRSK